MLKFYYTGAATYRAVQNQASASLGGFVSNSSIQNNLDNNLFPNISEGNIWEDKKSHLIGIFGESFFFDESEKKDYLDENNNVSLNIKFQWDFESINMDAFLKDQLESFKNSMKFYIALGPVSKNESDEIFMEKVQAQNALPFYLKEDFQELKEGEEINWDNVSSEGFGIWLRRVFIPENGLQALFDCYSEYWVHLAEQVDLEQYTIPNLTFPFKISINLKKK